MLWDSESDKDDDHESGSLVAGSKKNSKISSKSR